MILQANHEYLDQTVWLCRLIWDFAVYRYNNLFSHDTVHVAFLQVLLKKIWHHVHAHKLTKTGLQTVRKMDIT